VTVTGSGTVAEAVAALRPHLPECLVPAADADRITAVAALLPGALTTGFGFECHLGQPEPHADVLVRIKASEVGREVLAGTSAVDVLPVALAADPVWSRLISVARDWADPSHRFHRSVDNVWLEFDIDPDDDGMPVPGFFLGVYGGMLSRLRSGTPERSAADAYGWLVDEALPRVLGRPLAPATEAMLVRTLDAQPTGTNVFQVGVMLSRATDAVRLCLTDLPLTAVVAYLEGLGWAGDGDELAALVDRLTGLVDRVAVDIDVADRLSGKVGLECYLPDFGQPGDEPRWRTFLDDLVDRGLCRPEQRDGLLGYPGFTPDASVRHVAAASSLLGGRATSGYARVLHHVKVTYAPDAPVTAKAYFGAVHHWLTAGRRPAL